MADIRIGMKRTFSNRCVTIKAKKEMKKNLFMVAAVALVALTACNKEEVAGGNQDVQPVAPTAVVEFTASFSETKTALNAEGKKTLWVETDRIDINGQEFKIKELVDGGLAAKFENVNELPEEFAAPFTAKYPYGVAEVPATQTAKAGTFDPTAVLEIAESNDHNLSFTNVTSLLKFQVPAACQTVTISSDDVLAGSDAKTVTVNGSFEAGKTYYAAVLPGTKANFVVRIDGYLSKNATSVTIDESTIANMKTLPAPEASEYALIGSHTNSWSFSALTPLYIDTNNTIAAYNIAGMSEFKIVNKSATGWGQASTNKGVGTTIDASGVTVMSLSDDSNNIKVANSEIMHNIIIDATLSKIRIEESELTGEATKYSIAGSNGNWDSDIVFLTTNTANVIVAKNVTFKLDAGVKIRQDKSWTDTWSCDWKGLKVNVKMDCRKGYDCNMLFADGSDEWNKNYDMYVQLSSDVPSKFIIVESGSTPPSF